MDETTATLRVKLAEFAKRSVVIMTACTNEQSTKFSLVMPFLGFLGYEYANPAEVFPEHVADFTASQLNKVDLAILRDGKPIIAVECKKVGADITADRGQLRAYYNALPTAKLGILTNGIVFEFFVDLLEPNIMDEEPFLTLDLETAAREGITDEVLGALACVTKSKFDPDTIAETAHVRLVQKRLRAAVYNEVQNPSEDFCRLLLKKVDIRHAAKPAIDSHYRPLISGALGDLLSARQVQTSTGPKSEADPADAFDQRIFTTDRETEVFDCVRQRLAFLVKDEAHFQAIEAVRYRDFIGKLKVYYCKENKGRLFDYIESRDGCDKFIFPEPYGAIVTSNLRDLDEALFATFVARVQALSGEALPQRLARAG